MVLDRKCFFAFHTDTHDRFVVEMDVRHFHLGVFLNIRFTHCEAVVLRSHLPKAGDQILHRMIFYPLKSKEFLPLLVYQSFLKSRFFINAVSIAQSRVDFFERCGFPRGSLIGAPGEFLLP